MSRRKRKHAESMVASTGNPSSGSPSFDELVASTAAPTPTPSNAHPGLSDQDRSSGLLASSMAPASVTPSNMPATSHIKGGQAEGADTQDPPLPGLANASLNELRSTKSADSRGCASAAAPMTAAASTTAFVLVPTTSTENPPPRPFAQETSNPRDFSRPVPAAGTQYQPNTGVNQRSFVNLPTTPEGTVDLGALDDKTLRRLAREIAFKALRKAFPVPNALTIRIAYAREGNNFEAAYLNLARQDETLTWLPSPNRQSDTHIAPIPRPNLP